MIYYKNKPEFRRQLCKKPFRCRIVRGSIMGNKYTQLLAIKPASGRGMTVKANKIPNIDTMSLVIR